MKVPSDSLERYQFFQDILHQCLHTRAERRRNYNILRAYYIYGTNPEQLNRAVFNKIYPTIEQLSSFLFSPDTTRFTLELGKDVSDLHIPKISPMAGHLQQNWNTSNTDTMVSYAVKWAMCYGSMFVKTRWKRGLQPFIVDPHNFSVLREDTPGLSNQEAFAHTYLISETQLRNELEAGQHKRIDEIMARVQGSPRTTTPATIGPIDRIVVSQVAPNIIGSLVGGPWFGMSYGYSPKVAQRLVEMNELYIWDDAVGDYIVVTIADPGEVVWDRPIDKMFLKGEVPFVQICPHPAYDYFYGMSDVERLVTLQEMLNERMDQVRHLLELQAKPPKDASGFEGTPEEMALAMDTPNGIVSGPPGAKMTPHQPTIPDDIYKEVRELFAMFDEMSSLTNVNQGRGEAGVRSTGQANLLSRLGSARPKQRALVIEKALEKIATLYILMMRRYDITRLREDVDNGVEFIPDQFPSHCLAKVDAHSSSPIFIEDLKELAFALFDRKAIDREELLDLLNIPMRDLLKQKLKTKILPAEAKAAAEEKQLKIAELNSKRGGGKQ